MNIVFFGTSGFAVPALEKLLASPHRVMAVVTQPDRPAGRGQELHQSPVKEIALAKDLHLFQPENCNEYEFLRELRALSPDVIVVVAYGQKLGNDILQMPRFYVLNIHPSRRCGNIALSYLPGRPSIKQAACAAIPCSCPIASSPSPLLTFTLMQLGSTSSTSAIVLAMAAK